VITTALLANVQPLQLASCGQALLQVTADNRRSSDHELQQGDRSSHVIHVFGSVPAEVVPLITATTSIAVLQASSLHGDVIRLTIYFV
jgi:hypothetical protein